MDPNRFRKSITPRTPQHMLGELRALSFTNETVPAPSVPDQLEYLGGLRAGELYDQAAHQPGANLPERDDFSIDDPTDDASLLAMRQARDALRPLLQLNREPVREDAVQLPAALAGVDAAIAFTQQKLALAERLAPVIDADRASMEADAEAQAANADTNGIADKVREAINRAWQLMTPEAWEEAQESMRRLMEAEAKEQCGRPANALQQTIQQDDINLAALRESRALVTEICNHLGVPLTQQQRGPSVQGEDAGNPPMTS